MDKFLSPNFQITSACCEKYVKYFKENKDWKDEVEKEIRGGKLRVIQTFFNSVDECKKGEFRVQVLTTEDIQKMYPHLVVKSKEIPADKFLYIFACNDGISAGNSLIMDTLI